MDAAVVIASIDEVGTDTIAVEFESPDGFKAEPGQFVKLTGTVDGEEYSRFYTLSSPDVAETFETTIEIENETAEVQLYVLPDTHELAKALSSLPARRA